MAEWFLIIHIFYANGSSSAFHWKMQDLAECERAAKTLHYAGQVSGDDQAGLVGYCVPEPLGRLVKRSPSFYEALRGKK